MPDETASFASLPLLIVLGLKKSLIPMSSATIKLHVAELIPVATTKKKGFMPANFYANSTINLAMGYTYKIASTTSTYIYMEFIVNSYAQGFIGEARIRIAKSSNGEPVVKTALSVNGRFQVFYTLNDGETEIFIKVIKCNLLIAPSMDFRLNPYELNLKKEECELPNAAKEFDYE